MSQKGKNGLKKQRAIKHKDSSLISGTHVVDRTEFHTLFAHFQSGTRAWVNTHAHAHAHAHTHVCAEDVHGGYFSVWLSLHFPTLRALVFCPLSGLLHLDFSVALTSALLPEGPGTDLGPQYCTVAVRAKAAGELPCRFPGFQITLLMLSSWPGSELLAMHRV